MTNEEKARNYLAAYERVQKYFEIHNDHYFKRTQVLMIVIQSALFVALSRLVWGGSLDFSPNNQKEWIILVSLWLIVILGMLAAYAWTEMISRQHNVIEFCRCYLRDIEYRLMDLDIPLGYFTYEAKVFHRGEFHVFERSRERFPYGCREVKIRLMAIEKLIAISLGTLWSVCLVVILFYSVWKLSGLLRFLIVFPCMFGLGMLAYMIDRISNGGR